MHMETWIRLTDSFLQHSDSFVFYRSYNVYFVSISQELIVKLFSWKKELHLNSSCDAGVNIQHQCT